MPLDHSGAGAVMNELIHGSNQTLCQALILTEATGIASHRPLNAIKVSAAATPMLKYRRSLSLDEASPYVTLKHRIFYCSIEHELDNLKVPQVTESLRQSALLVAKGASADTPNL